MAELTTIKNVLWNKDTTGSLLHKHLLTHPETLDPIRKVEHLPDLDWESIEPKKGHRKKLLTKHWLTEKAYDQLIDAVNTLLNPVKVPKMKPRNRTSTTNPYFYVGHTPTVVRPHESRGIAEGK